MKVYTCDSFNDKANEGGSSSGGGGSTNKPDGGAGLVSANMPVIFGAVIVGGLIQVLL